MSALPLPKQLQDAYPISDMADVANPLAELAAAEEAAAWDHGGEMAWNSAGNAFTYAEPVGPRPYSAAVRLTLITTLAVASWIVVLAAGYAMVKALR